MRPVSKEVDLSSFEVSMVIRQMKEDDVKRILNMQELCFPGMDPWEESHLEKPSGDFS